MASTLEVLALAKLAFYDNKPSFFAYQTVAQSIPNGGSSYTPFTLDTPFTDNWGGWSSGSNTRYTVQVSGRYLVSGIAFFAANATGTRFAQLLKNGTTLPGTTGDKDNPSGSNQASVHTAAIVVPAVVGDYFQLGGYQTSGVALNTYATSTLGASLTVQWMSF